MKFKISEDITPQEEVDAINPDSAKLSNPVEFEGDEKFRVEFRFYDNDADGTVQQMEQQISAHGTENDVGTDGDGDSFSSLTLTQVFNSTEDMVEYLTSNLPLVQIASRFAETNSYMKIFVYELDTPNEKLDITDSLQLGSPTITDNEDTNMFLQALKKE